MVAASAISLTHPGEQTLPTANTFLQLELKKEGWGPQKYLQVTLQCPEPPLLRRFRRKEAQLIAGFAALMPAIGLESVS